MLHKCSNTTKKLKNREFFFTKLHLIQKRLIYMNRRGQEDPWHLHWKFRTQHDIWLRPLSVSCWTIWINGILKQVTPLSLCLAIFFCQIILAMWQSQPCRTAALSCLAVTSRLVSSQLPVICSFSVNTIIYSTAEVVCYSKIKFIPTRQHLYLR